MVPNSWDWFLRRPNKYLSICVMLVSVSRLVIWCACAGIVYLASVPSSLLQNAGGESLGLRLLCTRLSPPHLPWSLGARLQLVLWVSSKCERTGEGLVNQVYKPCASTLCSVGQSHCSILSHNTYITVLLTTCQLRAKTSLLPLVKIFGCQW